MRKVIALVCVVAPLVFAEPAASFSIIHPVPGECHQVLLPGDAFPGNWEVVSTTPAELPGPGTGMGTQATILRSRPVVCPAG